jgi:hypothetical protein
MSSSVDHNVILTIGFLNHDQETLLDKYAKAFDIVLLGDQSFEWINMLVSAIS